MNGLQNVYAWINNTAKKIWHLTKSWGRGKGTTANTDPRTIIHIYTSHSKEINDFCLWSLSRQSEMIVVLQHMEKSIDMSCYRATKETKTLSKELTPRYNFCLPETHSEL